jgi:hypothetical protein
VAKFLLLPAAGCLPVPSIVAGLPTGICGSVAIFFAARLSRACRGAASCQLPAELRLSAVIFSLPILETEAPRNQKNLLLTVSKNQTVCAVDGIVLGRPTGWFMWLTRS